MNKIIVGIPNCSKCKMLKEQRPDLEYKEIQPDDLIPFARATGIMSMPLVVVVDPQPDLI